MVFPFLKSSAIATFLALLFLCILFSIPSKAQIYRPALKKIGVTNHNSFQKSSITSGKLQIIAVMVEFQEDDNRFTTGTGLFGDSGMPFLSGSEIKIDPLPHNRHYFEAHLQFAKNYFETMSKGTLELDFKVIPEIVKLPGEMSRYSPTGRELDFLPVAELAMETWESVNKKNLIDVIPATDTETAFVIFHAGAGRDIELTGTTLTKTPQDIPSVYLNKESFRNIFNDPAFQGFPLSSSDVLITNTLVLPRTLSRPGEDVSGNQFVLQLSLNGLVTAQIGSHLGLPDLFDTETGQSGIGRFGLMDGAGIFSYNGLFPPEMSAWEKAYMGWTEPKEISSYKELTTELPAVSLKQKNPIAKLRLSKSEYFLIENRHRDPDGTGITIKIQKPDGSTVSQNFTNADRAFTFQEQGFEELLVPGVVTSVSNYDFSLPGGLVEMNEASDGLRELNGGILIWHIDENIIRENIPSNTINTGSGTNGVRLMEADGAQDIGNPISNGLFNNNSNGWAFDFWWNGNDASVITQSNTIQIYQNRFGPDTTPNNNSNSGASAGFEINNFSDNQPVASFSLRPLNLYSSLYSEVITSQLRDLSVSSFTSKSNSYWQAYPLSVQPITLNDEPHFVIPGSNGIEIFDPEQVSLLHSGLQTKFPIQQPLWNHETEQITIAEIPDENDLITVKSFFSGNQSIEQIWEAEVQANAGFISQSNNGLIDLDHSSEQIKLSDGTTIRNQEAAQVSESLGGIRARITESQLVIEFSEGEVTHSIPELEWSARKHTGIIRQSGDSSFVYLFLDKLLLLFSKSDNYQKPVILSENSKINWPAFGDIDDNGTVDVLFVDRESNTVQAKTITGASLPYFPLSAPVKSIFLGTPLLSDLDGDGSLNIIVQTKINSSISLNAYNPQADLLEGFPLLVGGGASGNIATIHPSISEEYLLAVSPEKELKLWMFPNNNSTVWASKYGNGVNNKVSGPTTVNDSNLIFNDLLVSDETYNWPNPAKNFTTIRFLTSESAKVDIDIITPSGKIIYSDSINTIGNIAEEVLVDTSKWASGAYYALVKAETNNQSGQKTIRIAIAK